MVKDNRQIRTTYNQVLCGYKGMIHGEKYLAIMKDQSCTECLGYISVKQLLQAVETGPYIDLEKVKMR